MTDKKTPVGKSGTVVKRCDCSHEYQDRKYGSGKRVFNLSRDGDKGKCTVCSKEA